ncbi:MAG: hypothetical protein PVI88_00160 [Nitrosopumilaceae archaeon]|jgi:hypothetical protein
MKTITIEEAVKLRRKWKYVASCYKNMVALKNDHMDELLKDGFDFCIIGTGDSAYTHSLRVSIQFVKSSLYLNGQFLIIGEGFPGRKKSVRYLGWCIRIEKD